jgi:hypothetical protein
MGGCEESEKGKDENAHRLAIAKLPSRARACSEESVFAEHKGGRGPMVVGRLACDGYATRGGSGRWFWLHIPLRPSGTSPW